MAKNLIEELLAEISKTAGEETSAEKKTEGEIKKDEKVVKADEKKEEKAEKKEEGAEKKEEKDVKKLESEVKAASLLSSLSVEQLDKLAAFATKLEEQEKVAEIAKQAEELETQGRFMYHGFAKEQLKVAYVLGQIEADDLTKTAQTLGWSVEDILKTADTHTDLVGEKAEPTVEGMGTQGGPASDMIAGGKNIGVAAKASGQTERKPEGAGELSELKNIINKVKTVRMESTNIPVNG